MKLVKYLFLVGALLMGGSIVYGFVAGDFTGDGTALLSLLWGKITIIDIYLAFLTFSGWMFFREGLNMKSIIIFLFILVLGSFTICFYTFWAMHRADGDWHAFWLGRKSKTE